MSLCTLTPRFQDNGNSFRTAVQRERILTRGNRYAGEPYTASVRILDETGNPLAGQALSYRVDGGERVNGTTDDNGFLRILLAEDALRAWPQLTFLADGSCDPVEEPEEEDPEDPGTSEEPGGFRGPGRYRGPGGPEGSLRI